MKTQTLLHKSARFIAVVMSIMVMAAMMPMLYTDSAVYAEDTAVTASQETAFTLDGKAYTRDQITAMESKEASFTYNTKKGEVTDYVKGVSIAELLKGYGDADVVTFSTADNYTVEASGKTVKELADSNYILAYAAGASAAEMKDIYNTAKGDDTVFGYFTLYGDNDKPAKMVNSITVKKAEVKLTNPVIKTAAKKGKASVKWAKVENADKYVVYRAVKKNGKYTKKTTTARTSYADKTVKKGKTYYYKVKAYNTDTKTYSKFSAVKAVKIK